MQNRYPPELKSFVTQQIADGYFATENELVLEAVGLYRRARFQLDRREGAEPEGIELRNDEIRDIIGDL